MPNSVSNANQKKSNRNLMIPYLAALLIVLVDRVTKLLVTQHLTPGESIPIIGDNFLRLTYVLNPGIAFGVRLLPPTFLLVFHIIASIALIMYLYYLRNQSTFLKVPLSLILGGAIGNVIDRIIYGEVIDFLDADFPDFVMNRWPVFNVADSAITIGITILIIYLIFQPRTQVTPSTPSSIPE
jgi:signal peptidase II